MPAYGSAASTCSPKSVLCGLSNRHARETTPACVSFGTTFLSSPGKPVEIARRKKGGAILPRRELDAHQPGAARIDSLPLIVDWRASDRRGARVRTSLTGAMVRQKTAAGNAAPDSAQENGGDDGNPIGAVRGNLQEEVIAAASVMKDDFVPVDDDAGPSKPAKRQKVSKELAVTAIGDGGGDLVKAERNDDRWDRKFEGQKFGEWSAEEKDEVNTRVKDWANAHGHGTDFEAQKHDYLFNRRTKQGGRGARLAASERKAFLEIAHGFATRNPKQVYAFISRHYNSNNHKGKWSEEEKKTLLTLVGEMGQKWNKIGEKLERSGQSCRDKWRMLKNSPKQGDWSPEEVSKLTQYVTEWFAAQGAQPGCGPAEGSEHLGLLDNINWKTISEKLGTRSENTCMQKWYRIAPDATAAGQWSAGEDSVLISNIIKLGAASESTTPWDQCVPGRDAVVVKRRFKQLKMSLSNSAKAKLSYDDLLKKLSEKFCQPAALPAPTTA